MKRFGTLASCLVLIALGVGVAVLVSAPAAAGDDATKDDSGYKRYDVEKLQVKYRVSGDGPEGEEILEFDRFGRRQRKLTIVKMLGFETKTLMLDDGKDTYNIDLKTNSATKVDPAMLESMMGKGGNDLSAMSKDLMKQMGGNVVGHETILERECEIWEIPSMRSKIWVWKGVPLKVEMTMPGMSMNYVALEVDEKPELGDADFALPDGVTVSEDQDPQEALKRLQDVQKMIRQKQGR